MRIKLAICLLLLSTPLLFADGQVHPFWTYSVQALEGTITSTVRTVTFDVTAYTVMLRNNDASTSFYYKLFPRGTTPTDITAGMIDTAGHRQTNGILILDPSEYISIDGNYSGISIIAAGSDNTDYRIVVLSVVSN